MNASILGSNKTECSILEDLKKDKDRYLIIKEIFKTQAYKNLPEKYKKRLHGVLNKIGRNYMSLATFRYFF